MALNTPENRQILINSTPSLKDDPYYYVSSEATGEYNCIAWAMGFTDRWSDHFPGGGKNLKKWWPEGVERGFNPDFLIKAFMAVGFECCDDDSYEEGYEKVALYKQEPFIDCFNCIFESVAWTHAAKVLTQNTYHSKMGPQFDIYHSSGNVLQASYGTIFQFMKRKIEDRQIVKHIIAQEQGITIPTNIVEEIANQLV